jgi:hypothetical protein
VILVLGAVYDAYNASDQSKLRTELDLSIFKSCLYFSITVYSRGIVVWRIFPNAALSSTIAKTSQSRLELAANHQNRQRQSTLSMAKTENVCQVTQINWEMIVLTHMDNTPHLPYFFKHTLASRMAQPNQVKESRMLSSLRHPS